PRPGEAQCVGEPRIGVRLAVRAPHAAAHHHVESRKSASLRDDQEPQVVRVHIAAVVVREGERDLELARQVPRAVDRVGLGRAACYRLAVRSEEHTSELQSRVDLVCRLLLEKNNGDEYYYQ